jgi:hypothetical protein
MPGRHAPCATVYKQAVALSLELQLFTAKSFSPEGTTSCSQGRQSLGEGRPFPVSPGGATCFRPNPMPPLRGFDSISNPFPGTGVPGYTTSPLRGLNPDSVIACPFKLSAIGKQAVAHCPRISRSNEKCSIGAGRRPSRSSGTGPRGRRRRRGRGWRRRGVRSLRGRSSAAVPGGGRRPGRPRRRRCRARRR